ncbi:uncharacterized protein JCM10292_004289 [Rhodotorula paludigena]|uniref:uncharacterized protein n=1 Tax=Rhodotorula paludigena TaxID=86838 RepID=UPI00317E8C6F
MQAVQPPPLILDLRNRSPPASPPSHPADSPSSLPSDTSSHASDAATSVTSEAPSLGDPLRDQIIAGLKGRAQPVVPGKTDVDRQFAYRRTIPTMTLYSQRGLEIYEDITNTQAYYPFCAEKEILEKYGDEIACRMFGLPSSVLVPEQDGAPDYEPTQAANKPAKKEKWGDPSVGSFNYGVNGAANRTSTTHATHGLAVELGSGSLDKTRHLLRSMAKLLQPGKKGEQKAAMEAIDYKALDLEAASLHSTLSSLASVEGDCVTTSLEAQTKQSRRRVSVSGLHATYDEGLAFLKAQNMGSPPPVVHDLPDSPFSSPGVRPAGLPNIDESAVSLDASPPLQPQADEHRSTSIMWLGSSCGNYTREEAVDFLRNIELREGDTMLIGIDGCADGPRIETAYNDPEGVTRAFILEGVDVAGRTLGGEAAEVLNQRNFEYVNRWNAQLGRHEAYVKAKSDLSIPLDDGEVRLEEGELLQIEVSYKYLFSEAVALFHLAGFRLVQHWTDSSRSHYLYLVEKPRMWFPSTKTSAAKMLGIELDEGEKTNDYGVPSLQEWEEMWKAWDALMLDTLSPELRFTKPIPLRHIPLFYIGHIPAFRDIHLSRYFNEPLTEPAHFADIFERGIDPNVDNPDEVTHWHSEVPQNDDGWPAIEKIVEYERKIRERVRKVYAEHEGRWTRKLARILMMVFEHEAMHWETSIYICLQACTKLNLPPGVAVPDFPSLARSAQRAIEAEGPAARQSTVSFEAQTISVGHDDREADDESAPYDPAHEYGWDVENPKREVRVEAFKMDVVPVTNGDYLDWLETTGKTGDEKLVPSSWAAVTGGGFAVKTLYGEVPMQYAREWPLAGCAEQLEAFAQSKGGRLPTFEEVSLFHQQHPVSTPLANIGFANLHPVPPTLPVPARDGSQIPATDGGLWQWTSTTLAAWKGYTGSKLYPGYSEDFMDDKHKVVLGSSYASPRRLARPSFLNWFQPNYRYFLGGARVAYDL